MSVSMEKPSQITGSRDSCKALDREDFPEPEGPSRMISFDGLGMVIQSVRRWVGRGIVSHGVGVSSSVTRGGIVLRTTPVCGFAGVGLVAKLPPRSNPKAASLRSEWVLIPPLVEGE